MIPRLVFTTVLLMLVAGLGYGALRLFNSTQPLPRATAMLAGGDPQGAQLLLRPLVKTEPRNAAAHVLLAQTQLDLSDPVAAEKELKIARALRYDRAVVNPLLARAYALQGRYVDILADIPGTAPRDDELVGNLVIRSNAYVVLGDLVQAQASLDEARRVAPDDIGVQVAQARIAMAKRDFQGARQQLDRVLGLVPTNLEALMLYGDVLNGLGDREGALAAMGKAVAAAPFSIPARVQRVNQYMLLGKDTEAMADISAAFGVNWHDNSVYFANAILLYRTGKYADAMVEFQKLAPVMDEMPRSYYYQALTAKAQEQYESAVEIVGRYLKLMPNDPEGLRLGAELELLLKRPERAVALLARAERAGAMDAQSYDLLGRAYFVLGRGAEAIGQYERAQALEPGNKTFEAHLTAARRLLSSSAPPPTVGAETVRASP